MDTHPIGKMVLPGLYTLITIHRHLFYQPFTLALTLSLSLPSFFGRSTWFAMGFRRTRSGIGVPGGGGAGGALAPPWKN